MDLGIRVSFQTEVLPGLLLVREVGGILILQVVQVFTEEGRGLFKYARHLFGCCVNQNHLCDVHDIGLIWLLREVAFVDLECLEIDAADQLTVRLAQFLNEREDLEGVFLMLKLDQVAEQLVEDLSEQGSLAHSCLSEEEVDLFSEFRVVFIKVEEDDFHLVVVEGKHLVEPLNAVEGCDPDVIDFIVQHVDEEVQALTSDLTAYSSKAAHRLDASQSDCHGVIFEHEEQDARHLGCKFDRLRLSCYHTGLARRLLLRVGIGCVCG